MSSVLEREAREMAVIDVTFINAGDGAEMDVELDDSLRTEQVIEALINAEFIPHLTNGIRNYSLTIKGRDHIIEGQTLAEAGVKANDRIRVASVQLGGGLADLLIIAASIASIAQVVLMVVEMWSKRTKEKPQENIGKLKLNKANVKEEKTPWNEVKEIRVLMSNGSWVHFDSWLAEPSKLRSFIDLYRLPSKSPKPLIVMFFLENGSKVQLVISDGEEDRHQLEHFINILNL